MDGEGEVEGVGKIVDPIEPGTLEAKVNGLSTYIHIYSVQN